MKGLSNPLPSFPAQNPANLRGAAASQTLPPEDAPLDPADPSSVMVGGMRRILQRWPAKPLGVIEYIAECQHGKYVLDRASRIASFLTTHRACK